MSTPTQTAQPGADTLYTVVAGDSLSKIAQRFYGDPLKYPVIADRNAINPQAILTIGQRLILPALQPASVTNVSPQSMEFGTQFPESTYFTPSSPGGSVPQPYGNTTIETVTTSAARIQWWHDWRVWAGVALGVGVLLYVSNKRR